MRERLVSGASIVTRLWFDGGEVERRFHEGKIKEIADYCEIDVINTYQVWLRYELFRGTCSRNGFDARDRSR
jgi:predicted PolB exonuclease-like 3'-5' exonuclease